MSFLDTSLIRRYEQNEHFYFPEMEKLLDEVIANPEKAIVIPDNFVSKSIENSHFLLVLVQKIAILFKKIVTNIKCSLSKKCRQKFNFAVSKIKDAWNLKVATISRVRDTLLSSRTNYENAKNGIFSLQNRITLLELENETSSNKLQESIDTKNLIVQHARALKFKREPALTILNNSTFSFVTKVGALFSAFVPLGTESEVSEIKERDPAFPVEELTDEIILHYENEEFEGSSLITKLKEERVSVSTNQSLFEEEQARLEAVSAVANTALEGIKTVIQEIDQMDLENFFDAHELMVPESDTEVSFDRELTHNEMQLASLKQDIKTKSHVDLATLFSLLVGRLPEDALSEWRCDEEGNFSFKLNKMYSVWVPESDITGGVVIILGNSHNNEVTGKLEQNKVLFLSGMTNYLKNPIPIPGAIYVEPTFLGISFNSRQDIQVGGACLGCEQWKSKTFGDLKRGWSVNSILVPDDYPGGHQKFLEDKVANS